MGKGGSFEREMCKKFSLWWTEGQRDDIFWRTAGSGARATVRAKKGQGTKNSYGDMMAIDPIGEPLLKVVTVEFKRGYSAHIDITGLIDTDNKNQNLCKKPKLIRFISQAYDDSVLGSTKCGSLLICKRDRKKEIVIFESRLLFTLREYHGEITKYPYCEFSIPGFIGDWVRICMRLDHFFDWVHPNTFKDIINPSAKSQTFGPLIFMNDLENTVKQEFGEPNATEEKEVTRKRRKI